MSTQEQQSLGALVRKAVPWSALNMGVTRLSNFGLGLLMARLLAPRDFGVFAVALVVHMIVINISELGVGVALVRDAEEQIKRTLPTVVTIGLVSGAALGILMIVSASSVAALLGSPAAAGVIVVMALNLPLAGLSAAPYSLLRRKFRLDLLFWANTAGNVISIGVAIPLAVDGYGPLALAWSWVAGQVVTTVMLVAFMPKSCRPGFDPTEARRVLKLGLPLTGANIVGYALQNVDYVVVAKLLGAVPLGIYMLAFNIAGWPQGVISTVVRDVSFPAFSRIRQEGGDLPYHFMRALRAVSSVTFPVCLLLGALSHPLVIVLYGQRWAGASNALFGLSVFAAVRCAGELFADFLVAMGRGYQLLVTQLIWLTALTGALVLGVRESGIGGAGAAQAVVAGIVVLPMYLIFVRRTGIQPADAIAAILPSLVMAVVAALVAWVIASQVANPWLACLSGGSAGCAVYSTRFARFLWQRATRGRHSDGDPGLANGFESLPQVMGGI